MQTVLTLEQPRDMAQQSEEETTLRNGSTLSFTLTFMTITR